MLCYLFYTFRFSKRNTSRLRTEWTIKGKEYLVRSARGADFCFMCCDKLIILVCVKLNHTDHIFIWRSRRDGYLYNWQHWLMIILRKWEWSRHTQVRHGAPPGIRLILLAAGSSAYQLWKACNLYVFVFSGCILGPDGRTGGGCV